MSDESPPLATILTDYVSSVRSELADRWRRWATTLADLEKYEVIGGLLARQVSLATQIARNPSIWNAHLAPVLLRTMVDTHLTLAWILRDPLTRARQFILYGLGQYKLFLEHIRVALGAQGANESEIDATLSPATSWLESQRFTSLTEVNVGAWSGLSARDMAEEVGLLDFYNYTYTPFSAASHSMWHHIGRLNVERCESPLHRFHHVPVDPDLPSDFEYLYRAAKFADMSFRAFDSAMSISTEGLSAFDKLKQHLEHLGSKADNGNESSQPTTSGTPSP